MDGLTPDERAWCAERIAEHTGRLVTIAAAEAVPSRLAGVWRLRIHEAPTAFYLKRYPPEEPRHAELSEHFALLRDVAAAVDKQPDLTPYRVIACLPAHRLVLSEETPGSPVAWLHRDLPRSARARTAAERAWAGVGKWLATLHGQVGLTQASADRAAQLADYTRERFERWAAIDPAHRELARDAGAAAHDAARAVAGSPVGLVPCHGDVSTHNIIVGDRVGLIDFDDLRYDFAATDLSLVLLEIAQFSRIGSMLPIPGLKDRFTRAFRSEYRQAWPAGAEFRLPHLRNLAVFVLTLAGRRGPLSVSQLSTRAHYRTTIDELRRTVGAI